MSNIFTPLPTPPTYPINLNKLKKAPKEIIPYILTCFCFEFSEKLEYFDKIKPYLDIPEKPKTLEEISQELDEKIDDLIERTKKKFYGYKVTAEKKYEYKFDKIFDDFEYANKNGKFPLRGSFYITAGDCNSPCFGSYQIRVANACGFYSLNGGSVQLYLEDKPTAVVRFFMKLLLGLCWTDD